MVTEKEIDNELASFGLTRDLLKNEEIEELRRELEARKNGAQILDGVLSDTGIYYRRLKNQQKKD